MRLRRQKASKYSFEFHTSQNATLRKIVYKEFRNQEPPIGTAQTARKCEKRELFEQTTRDCFNTKLDKTSVTAFNRIFITQARREGNTKKASLLELPREIENCSRDCRCETNV